MTSPHSQFGFCFLILMLLISCKQKQAGNPVATEQKVITVKIVKHKSVDTILNSINGIVDGQHFVVTCTSGYKLFVLNAMQDTVYQNKEYSPYQEFVDFNGDGYKDILIDYMTNVPGIFDLLLYNKDERTFKPVKSFQDFPDPKRIAGSNYYYSYHRSGCADYDWDSDLFYIKNYKAIKIGNIKGNQCHNRDIKDGIYIYKVMGKKQLEIIRLPIDVIEQYKDKWGFIKHYWNHNYKRFL